MTRREHLLASSLLFVYTAFAHYPLLRPGQSPWSSHSDVIALDLLWKDLLSQRAALGEHFPLFQNTWLFGSPLLTHPQAMALHPLHFLFHVLRPEAALGPTFALLFFLSGLGTYALGRALNTSFTASMLTGFAAVTSFKLVAAAYAGWVGALCPIVLVPWILAALLHFTTQPSVKATFALCTVLGLAFAGPSPQVPLYTLWMALPLLLASGTRGLLRRSLALALATVLGVSLSAYLWLPVVCDLSSLTRVHSSFQDFIAGHPIGLAELRTLFDPEALGSPLEHSFPGEELWEDLAYFGLLPLLLALLALVARRESFAPRWLGLAFLTSLALACSTPLTHFFHDHLPGYRLFRLPGRMLYVTSFLGLGLAPIGWDAIDSRLRAHTRAGLRLILIALSFVFVAIDGVPLARSYLSVRPYAWLRPAASHPLRTLALLSQTSS